MEPDLYLISWNVTRRCNLHCPHCYLPALGSENDPEDYTGRELETGEALRVIDQIALVNPETLLILSGGEPLLRKDILALAQYASGKGMMVVLGSNGLLLNDRVAFELKRGGVSGVSITLDSVDPGIHDALRSMKGAWNAAVEAIRCCRRNGLAVQINSTITQYNYTEVPRLIKYSQTVGARVFSPFFLICTGRGEELTDITPGQYEETLSWIVQEQGNQAGMMGRPRCAPTFRRILYQKVPDSLLLKMDTGRCLAGAHYCRITPEGRVTPCPYLPLHVGDLRRISLKELWTEAKEFLLLRNPTLNGKCGVCEFKRICGGCRARAWAHNKDFMGEDPWCSYNPQQGGSIKTPSLCSDSFASNPGCGDKPSWTEESQERLKRIPFFVRSMVKGAVERYALEKKYREITPSVMDEAKSKLARGKIMGH